MQFLWNLVKFHKICCIYINHYNKSENQAKESIDYYLYIVNRINLVISGFSILIPIIIPPIMYYIYNIKDITEVIKVINGLYTLFIILKFFFSSFLPALSFFLGPYRKPNMNLWYHILPYIIGAILSFVNYCFLNDIARKKLD